MPVLRRVMVLIALLLAPILPATGAGPDRILCICDMDHPDLFLADGDGQNAHPLAAGPGPNYNAAFSADGRWIVFTSNRAGNADIYRMHPDGIGLERLTDDPAFDDQAALSPDGRTLAFVSTRRDGTADVWLLDLASRRYRNLTEGKGGNYRPSWSPDGKWLAFTSDRDTHPGRADPQWELLQLTALYIVHPDGSGLRRLTPLDQFASNPHWSPDGRRIVYSQAANIRGTHLHQADPAVPQLVTIDVGSGARLVLTSGASWKLSPQYAGGDIAYLDRDQAKDQSALVFLHGRNVPMGRIEHPSWSPDGRTVVYQKPGYAFSWMTPVAARDARYRLFQSASVSFPAWSPDGRRFVYGNGRKLRIMNADGSDLHDLFDTGAREKVIAAVSWSPDGETIAFAMGHGMPDPVGQIVIIHPDGTGLRILTQSEASSDFPGFSPDGQHLVYRLAGREQGLRILSIADGRITHLTDTADDFPAWSPKDGRIVFTSFRTGDFELETINADGSGRRQITHDHGNDGHPVWSPDGQWIAFAGSGKGWKDEGIFHGGQPYGDIFVMRPDGTDVRQLTDNQWEDAPAAWIP